MHKPTFLLMLSSLLFALSCSVEDQKPPAQIAPQTQSVPGLPKANINPKSLKSDLSTLAKGLAGVSVNKGFRQIIYDRVEETFDGDYNVLLEVLDKSATAKGLKFQKEAEQFLDENGEPGRFSTALNRLNVTAMPDISLEKPQIFIPYYTELKEKGVIGLGVPTLVIFDGDESKTEVQGYKINPAGKLIALPKLINEAYAKENEVWVVSLNERQTLVPQPIDDDLPNNPDDGDGEYTPVPIVCNDGNDDGGDPLPEGIEVFLKNLRVTCHKESWLNGGSEVFINLTSAYGTGYDPETGEPFEIVWRMNAWPIDYDDGLARVLKNLTRTEVDQKNTYYGPFGLTGITQKLYDSQGNLLEEEVLQWGTKKPWMLNFDDQRGDHIYYVIYELDNGLGAFDFQEISTTIPPFNTFTVKLNYQSANNPYDYGSFSWYKNGGPEGVAPYPCDYSSYKECISYELYTGPFSE